MFLKEFLELFPLLLLGASALSFFAHYTSPGEGYDMIAYALFAVVLLNSTVSFIQKSKVEQIMRSFMDYIPEKVLVIRRGEERLIGAENLVPGDIMLLKEGDKIAADSAIIETSNLLVDESILTGESGPVNKVEFDASDEPDKKTGLVFSGTTILTGDCKALVISTGKRSSFGSITDLAQNVKQDLTPMQKELKDFVKKITFLALGIGFVFFCIGFFIGNQFWTNLVFAIGIIVANVPEGLLPTVTLALTQASRKMAKRKAVVKNILSVETLGSTTVICTDKTGTLTQNKLEVVRLFSNFEDIHISKSELNQFMHTPAKNPILEVMNLCNDADRIVEGSEIKYAGDPTEVALREFSDLLVDSEHLKKNFFSLDKKSFNSKDKYMAGLYRTSGNTLYTVVKGAPEVILEKVSQVHHDGNVRAISDEDKAVLKNAYNQFSKDGLRVLAMAYNVGNQNCQDVDGLVFLGFVGMMDMPRKEVYSAVKACQAAGIKIFVVSGDNAETIKAITKKVGISEDPFVVNGEELQSMSDSSLYQIVKKDCVVFARTSPSQKLRIVEAVKAVGEVVAVTGDGVNDAPALKKADIGVSMGQSGTDVAKEASDIILLDDNFATIVAAVEEGRTVYDNIKRFITYILTSNIPEILPFIAYVLFPIPLPITVIQILCIDLITDILPAIGLGNEPPESDTMTRPPRKKTDKLVTAKTFLRSYGIIGPFQALFAFALFFLTFKMFGIIPRADIPLTDPVYMSASVTFLAAIIISQIGNVLACRTNRQSAIPRLKRLNKWILWGVVIEILFLLAITNLPFLYNFFNSGPIRLDMLPYLALTPILLFMVEELRKLLVRKGVKFFAV